MTTEQFGKFTRTKLLGEGGMGEVWKAWDAQLGRWVALKFLKSGSAESIARFQREAQIASRLSHPHIAAIYEVGTDQGQHFIAMQFVEGAMLKPGEKRAVELISGAARAVHFAHEHGVIHRDLKPDNLMVTADGHLFVMDFGLARPTEGRSDVSRSGMLVGTPHYMPPEQARGEKVDARADVYSLGATLYEILSGRKPFQGKTVIEILTKVVDGDPVPPQDLPRDLQTIVMKCLEKDRERRYATAAELAEELDRFLGGEAILARPASSLDRMSRFLRRHRAAAAAVVVALIGIVATAGFILPGMRRETEARRANEAKLAAERREAESLRDLGTLWAEVLLAKQGLYKNASDPKRVMGEIREATAKVTAHILNSGGQPQSFYVRARASLYLNDLSKAEEDLRASVRLNGAFGPGHALLGRVLLEQYTRNLYGRTEELDLRKRESLPLLVEAEKEVALGADQKTIAEWGLIKTPEDDAVIILVRALLAAYRDGDWGAAIRILGEANEKTPSEEFCIWLGSFAGEPDRRIEWFTRALEIMPHFARALFERGISRKLKGDVPGAIRDFTTTLEIDPRHYMAMENRGIAYAEILNNAAALDDFTVLLQNIPRHVNALTWRAIVRRRTGDLDGSIADSTLSIEVQPTRYAYECRARARLQKNDREGGIRDFTAALAIAPENTDYLNGRGTAYDLMGRTREAYDDFTKLIGLDPNHAVGWFNRGNMNLVLGDFDAAVGDFERALAISPRYGEAHFNRAVALRKLGRLEEAQAACLKGIEVVPEGPVRERLEKLLRELRMK